jgi:hypothetical protein
VGNFSKLFNHSFIALIPRVVIIKIYINYLCYYLPFSFSRECGLLTWNCQITHELKPESDMKMYVSSGTHS